MTPSLPVGPAEFASLIAPLGPFEPQPHVAVAVSGGADSLATALLVRDWVRDQGGDILALVVDHGLRTDSRTEAETTIARLFGMGIEAVLLPLTDLAPGPGIAARARDARHAVLEAAAARRGILHLVFGHHAADQAETVCMRLLAGSGEGGLAGMSPLVETARLRRLRPLLSIPSARLRATLRVEGLGWVEDPSNRNPTQQRARLRALRGDPAGDGLATRALVLSAAARGVARAAREAEIAAELAAKAAIYPHGFAHLQPGRISAEALAALVAMIAGASWPISPDRVRDLAEQPRPATIAGVQIVPAGRYGAGVLLVREAAAVQGAVPARHGMVWDGRFRLTGPVPEGCEVGAWAQEAPRTREIFLMIVARTLPVLRCNGRVIAKSPAMMDDFVFTPRFCASPARFFPLPVGAGRGQSGGCIGG